MIQGSDEWKAARLGKVTASRMADLMAKTKTGYGAGRANLMAKLITEKLTGVSDDNYTNAAMSWGIEHEAEARAAYIFHCDMPVCEVGFIDHPYVPDSGASPDGTVGDDGLVEIKCPQSATHIDTLLSKAVPDKYVKQMLWQMACTGRKWCDFVSYDPRMPANLSFFVKRVEFGAQVVKEMEAEVVAFLAEMNTKIEQLRAL